MNVNYWTDSMNVLWWVRNHSRKFKPFVVNRISEIQRLSAPGKWNHEKTNENVADLLSQGMSIEDLAVSGLCWYSPDNSSFGKDWHLKFLRCAGRESHSSCHDVKCHTVRYTIIMETKSKELLIMEKTNKNFWLGILVHNKCKKIILWKD